jgi:3-phosphoshikimate 1-carboxyvinyltransferase
VRGPLTPGEADIDGSVSSQLLTGLLMALPACAGDSVLHVHELKSKPYIRLTLRLLEQFGIQLRANASLSRFEIPGRQKYRARSYRVEGDWSGAAFPLVAGAIAGRVELSGLVLDSAQADRAVLEALESAGARVRAGRERVAVEQSSLRGFDFDAAECPDLFPPLVALACFCSGTTTLRGAGRLRHKESDRASALLEEFTRIGARVRLDGDLLLVTGGTLEGGEARSHGDHRIAMALAVAALGSRRGVSISGEEAVAKSYPEFFDDLDTLRRTP